MPAYILLFSICKNYQIIFVEYSGNINNYLIISYRFSFFSLDY